MPAGSDDLQDIPLSKLDLDTENPRLGAGIRTKDQTVLLDHIVSTFGIEDVLGSIAVNGYFRAEPMVGYPRGNRFVIAEGNRRLAACLILTGDERARNQEARHKKFDTLRKQHKTSAPDTVPVLVYQNPKEQHLLSYLGVRHISSSQPWDSFAKAAWIDRVMSEEDLTLTEIGEMIGDQHRTVQRIVEGYRFIKKLEETGRFNPDDSQRAGRGSNSKFPFSWVYTTLGYKPVREWIGMPDLGDEPSNKLGSRELERGQKLLTYLFGNRSQGRSAAIQDSREIGILAQAVADPEGRRLLDRGKSAKDYQEATKPFDERIEQLLDNALSSLEECQNLVPQAELEPVHAFAMLRIAKRVEILGRAVSKELSQLAVGEDDD